MRPVAISLVDSSYNLMLDGNVTYTSGTQVTVNWPDTRSGYAALTFGEGTSGSSGSSGSSGIAGSSGTSGADGGSFVHTQGVAGSVWSVNHGLGRPVAYTVTDSNYNVIVPETVKFVSDGIARFYFNDSRTGYVSLTFGEGTSGSTGTSGSSGADGSNAPGGSVNDIQFKSGASTLGGTTDFKINTSGSPATVHLQGPMYSSSGTSGFHAININGNATVGGNMTIGGAVPATQDDVIALAIALG